MTSDTKIVFAWHFLIIFDSTIAIEFCFMKGLSISIPTNEQRIAAAVVRAKQHVARQALLSAGTTFIPIPGVDMLMDVTVLIKMMEQINQEFGLTPEQIEKLPSTQKIVVYEAINWVGVALAGKIISVPLATSVLKSVGAKVSVKQASRWAPIVGQATAAAIGYGALRYLGQKHIDDCAKVARQVICLLEHKNTNK